MGTLPPHAYFIPFSGEEAALTEEREAAQGELDALYERWEQLSPSRPGSVSPNRPQGFPRSRPPPLLKTASQ